MWNKTKKKNFEFLVRCWLQMMDLLVFFFFYFLIQVRRKVQAQQQNLQESTRSHCTSEPRLNDTETPPQRRRGSQRRPTHSQSKQAINRFLYLLLRSLFCKLQKKYYKRQPIMVTHVSIFPLFFVVLLCLLFLQFC